MTVFGSLGLNGIVCVSWFVPSRFTLKITLHPTVLAVVGRTIGLNVWRSSRRGSRAVQMSGQCSSLRLSVRVSSGSTAVEELSEFAGMYKPDSLGLIG